MVLSAGESPPGLLNLAKRLSRREIFSSRRRRRFSAN
jgi:hypothetical protein